MTCSDTCSIIAMEIFIEQNVVFPVRILLELFSSSIDRSATLFIFKKYAGKTFGNIFSYLDTGSSEFLNLSDILF